MLLVIIVPRVRGVKLNLSRIESSWSALADIRFVCKIEPI